MQQRSRLPHRLPHALLRRRARQQGQALLYGLFVLLGGLLGLFFMFNTGQLTAEKSKLVNTADAVAYSAAVMHARALNFDAYTNRALMANEVLIAQMVSIDSYMQYASEHVNAVPPLACYTQYNVPAGLVLLKYTPLCMGLATGPVAAAVNAAQPVVSAAAQVTVVASEVVKAALQLAQTTMYASFLPARHKVMQQVADANYLNDGVVKVDTVPLHDNFTLFDGKPFITPNAGSDRQRFKDVELAAANRDNFVSNRSWNDSTPWGCLPGFPLRGEAHRSGETKLIGFDEWRASDRARLVTERWGKKGWLSWGCKTISTYNLGDGDRKANKGGIDWLYSGVPTFYDLSTEALAYTPDNADENKRDPRLKFTIRLTRDKDQTMTSDGRSAIKPTGRMAVFDGAPAKDVLAAVATSEVYFERPVARDDGKKELPSLFNPYWQAHLSPTSAASLAAALALQEPKP